jgi:hypothetical protein
MKVQVKKLKRKSIIIGLAAVLIIVIIGGYLGWSYYIGHPSVEQVRDMTMAYIKAHHKETAQYMQSFSWTGKDITPEGFTGGRWYSYQSAGWNITIQYPVALPPGSITIYSVTATYTSQVTPGEVIVSWQGTLQNGLITQTTYTFNP